MLLSKRFFILALVTFLTACASSEKEKVPENLSEAELYRQAQQSLENSNYSQAVDKLRALESRYPFGPFAEQAQLDLVYAYYKNMEPEAARASAERFIRLHPQHPNVDYAYYMRGLASNTADLGLIERYVPVDMSKRDPGQARQSFNEFSELLQRFPDSPYASDARQRMIALRNRLSYYELHVANYYMKRKAYVAAINRGRYIVEHMQGTPVVEEALGMMVEGYQHLNLEQPANEALEVLKTNFPDSKLIGENGEFTGYKVYADVDPSVWNIITFGLVDGKPADEIKPDPYTPRSRSWLNVITFGLLGDSGNEATAPKPPEQSTEQ